MADEQPPMTHLANPEVITKPPVAFHDNALIAEAERARRYVVFCRKHLIRRRLELEGQWRQFFPHHDFADLHLIQPDAFPRGWDEAAWRKTAREYHDNRRKGWKTK